MPEFLRQVCVRSLLVDQVGQSVQHELRREQFGQISQFPWAVRVFQWRAADASQAGRISGAIGRENLFEPQLVPPDGSMGIVKTVVIEELLLEL